MDLYETTDMYILYVDLPGIPRDQIEVQVRQRSVLIRGTRGEPESGRAAERLEIRTGRFEREIELPGRVDASGASALIRDGVLRLHLPREAVSAVAIRIDEEDAGGAEAQVGHAP